MTKIHEWINTALVIAIFFLVLVGGNNQRLIRRIFLCEVDEEIVDRAVSIAAILLAVFPEFYAILGFLISLLAIMIGIQL